ncbi:hypothetical protein K435DRAFT_798552 [Dendrothele bispora CBS 962.96]|uniref:Uncharacterized protein n=1 Tax=Dendrothele bispora (strain CBS 962.96) TaxID=1314807 RepID=A0A4S8LZA2_DENBC|nr:hypothetical protein K435DRAFT_798552 [Dendrothele bispora CBS 962.96]
MAPSEDILDLLTHDELLRFTQDFIHIPRSNRRRKADIISFVLQYGPDELLTVLEQAASPRAPTANPRIPKRRRDNNVAFQRNTIRRVHEPWDQQHDPNQFLCLPSKEELHGRYERFYEATSNDTIAMAVCGICGREVGVSDHEVVKWHLNEFTPEHT